MEYQHLLVPVDFRLPDQRALQTAFDLALQHQAHTTLLYVIESIDDDGGEDEDEDEDEEDELQTFYAQVECKVRKRLVEMVQRFQDAGLEVRLEIVVGRTAHTVIQFSSTEKVDLIVMQAARIDVDRPEQALASVSHQVSLFCPCPLMLLK